MTMLSTYTIAEALGDGFATAVSAFVYTFPYTYTKADGTTDSANLNINGRDFIHEFGRFTTFGVVYDTDLIEAIYGNNVTKLQALVLMWEDFIKYNSTNMGRILGAYMSEYDPISNYNSRETHEYGAAENSTSVVNDEEGVTESYSAPQAVLLKSSGISRVTSDNLDSDGETNTVEYGKSTTEYTMAFDDPEVTDHLTGKTVDGDSDTTTNHKPQSAGFIYTKDPETTTTDSLGEHTDTFTKSGNIGVTTAQSMIEEEIKLRKLEVPRYLVEQFVFQNCIACTERDE